ncbi:glycosyltransferase family 1 protein [Sinomonas sp. ASV322]|uniref:rhamnosyltransferase WsaF family glycosyltransferase n=1 Tax=Sinomonas sp. ASV322 TaxID=3041920 RepID=UPI0027DDCEDA|nr:glycosyltransferase family 1 protein [Sinomonas sp. ASV322]MDQ4504340.1 glycosyltransferase family 1 protein [Sinomonas sp. ASV322]
MAEWREGGSGGLRASGTRWLRRKLGSEGEDLHLRTGDFATAPEPWRLRARDGSRPLSVTWLVTPPGPGSGGHTTIFRMVRALEDAGHACRLAVYDGRGRPASLYAETIRQWWPAVRAPVVDVDAGTEGTDVFVATAWQTAHVLANVTADGARLYFAQDYEPWFYAQGAVSELADRTYGFGFETFTVGQAIADELSRRHGVEPTVIPYGCDHEVYGVDESAGRDSVVFYSRPGVARRGFEIALPALERFHGLRPDVEIHVVGPLPRAGFPAVVHSTVTPAELNRLYQRCAAGLALSYTNVSLLPFELLASGVVPVMNDWAPARTDLDDPSIVWAASDPESLAQGLCRALEVQAARGPKAVAAGVADRTWSESGRVFVSAVERSCSRPAAVSARTEGGLS